MNGTSLGRVYSIGYTAFPVLEDFIAELKKYGVRLVIDVRSDPQYKNEKGIHNIGDAYIVVSIPHKPFTEKDYYKFVAAIYPIK